MRKVSNCLIVFCMVIYFLFGGTFTSAETKTHVLNVEFLTEFGAIRDAEFKLYYALTPDGKLSGAFSELSVDPGNLEDSENLSRLAFTLASYAACGFGTPVATGKTDGLGSLNFSNLASGMYLVTGFSKIQDNVMYTPKPTLIYLSENDTEPVMINIKYKLTANSGETTSHTVRKVWKSSEGSANPVPITVQLFQSGKFYDEVTLSSENNWEYTWKGLSTGYDWYVIEKVIPVEYFVSVTMNETTFVVVNTRGLSSGIWETGESTEATETTVPDIPDVTETGITDFHETTTTGEKIFTDVTETTKNYQNSTKVSETTTNKNHSSTKISETTTNKNHSYSTESSETTDGKSTNITNSTNTTDTTNTTNTTYTQVTNSSGNSSSGKSSTPSSGGTVTKTNFNSNSNNSNNKNGGNSTPLKLPQTGQLWYPVPILFLLGLFLFLIGFVAGDDNEKE